MSIQNQMRVSVDGREGITVRKGRNTEGKGVAFWVLFDDTGMMECHFDSNMEQLEEDRPKKTRKKKAPPQKEVFLDMDEVRNDYALTDAYREEMLK